MKFNKKKVSVVALSALLGCSTLAGCDFITANPAKDLLQVVAEVNITKGDAFQKEYAEYTSAIETSQILKRDVVAGYASMGYQYVNSYGYTVEQALDTVVQSLVSRQIYLQYTKAYMLDSETQATDYTVQGYQTAVSGVQEGASDLEKQIAGLGYFLDEDERAIAEYQVRVALNSTIDSQETVIIDAEEEEHVHDSASERATPNGINTQIEDYYDKDYQIYTGFNQASYCGSYETVDGSTPATRRKAYGQFLASLETYQLVNKGENTSDINTLSYYRLEVKNAYEDALINKMSEAFEKEAEAKDDSWIINKYNTTLETQKAMFESDESAFQTALDGVSDSSFVLYSPDNGYGFVYNILLPFSTAQSSALEESLPDAGDVHGNKFVSRANLLKQIKATDQRKGWFDEAHGYSFEAKAEDNAFINSVTSENEVNYLFFEDSVRNTDRYESVPNYLGKYPYNGTVTECKDGDHEELTFKPNAITIDGFISEMKGYLGYAGYALEGTTTENYYEKTSADYYGADGEVDYSSFVYYTAKVTKEGKAISETFNANNVFVKNSVENKAMSVMNELSFAYNTDTAGLNTYLGYVVSSGSTNFVKEFEYAAQAAVKGGAGTVVIAPSDYGWHVIYCTFSYAESEPFSFDWNEKDTEGSFSNLYYEALKASNLTTYATNRQAKIITTYDNDSCVETFEKRYSDLYTKFGA